MNIAFSVGGTLINNLLKRNLDLYKMNLDNNHEVISRLKFIGLIKKYHKINISSLSLQPVWWRTTLSRTFLSGSSESRNHALKFIESTINRSFELITKYSENEKISGKCLAKNIIYDIIKSLEGINNMKYTYEDDIKFVCDLEIISQSIIPQLKEIYNIYPELFLSNDDSINDFIKDITPLLFSNADF